MNNLAGITGEPYILWLWVPKVGGPQEENGYHHVTDEVRSSHQVCRFVVPMLLHISGEISVEGDSWKQTSEIS